MKVIKEQIEGDHESIFESLNQLKSWLSRNDGLGLQSIIDNILDEIKTNIGEDDIEKYIMGANILKDNGKIKDYTYNRFLESLPAKRLVYIDGEWHPVNKLNTNFSDLAKLLTDLLFLSKNNGRPAATEIINTISNSKDEDEVKEVLLKYKDNLSGLFSQYLSSPNELLDYTTNIRRNSEWGEKIENEVADTIGSIPGYELLYQGGDGDFIDMIFSTDLIFKSSRGEVKTIQVKSSEGQGESFKKDVSKGKHKAVDILIYPNKDEFIIYSIKDGDTKTIKRKKQPFS
jgi:hypothetical protein